MTSNKLLTIRETNALSLECFKLYFGNVIEFCPEAAQEIGQNRPFTSIDKLKKSFYDYIDNLDQIDKEMLLKKHPNLGDKKYKTKQLTDESQKEQKSAGIDVIDSVNKKKLENLNKEYENKFLFPFIICARENTVQSIITAIQIRLMNNRMIELHNAIEEVKKICSLRIDDLICHEST